MNNLTIRQRILGSFAAVLVVMSIMAALTFLSLIRTENEAISVETKTVPGLFYSLEMMAGWIETQTLVQDLALSDTDAARQRAIAAIEANRDYLRGLMVTYETPSIPSRTSSISMRSASSPTTSSRGRMRSSR
jgi:methyl-accepting chemotaxis protein WspA